MDQPLTGHDPVMLSEVIDLLQPASRMTIVDGTLGRAGHALAIVKLMSPGSRFIGLDVDPRNLSFAKTVLKDAPCEVRLFHANFAELADVMAELKIDHIDGILADLGISTNQLFEPAYGLSFSQAMPLDMRLDPRSNRSAADIVNKMPEEDLANVLYELAQERYSRRIARKIGDARRVTPIITTDRLAEIVRSAVPRRGGAPERIDPATRTFMALRMLVNRELENLDALLKSAPGTLSPGGRMAVISFHSTEDRVVKQAFRSAEQAGHFTILTKKPLTPSDDETTRNPRSRSAKLRAIQKVG